MLSPLLSFCLSFVTCLLFLHVNGSHHRGGTFSFIARNSNNSQTEAYGFIQWRVSWRRTAYSGSMRCTAASVGNSSAPLTGDSGAMGCSPASSHGTPCWQSNIVDNVQIYCTSFSVADNWMTGANQQNLAIPRSAIGGAYNARWSSNAWIAGLSNNNGGSWMYNMYLNMKNRGPVGGPIQLNSCPLTQISPVVIMNPTCNYSSIIPSADNDGDEVRCRWSTAAASECIGACITARSPFTLGSNCNLGYLANPSITNQQMYALSVQVEDFPSFSPHNPLCSVPLKFLVKFDTSVDCQPAHSDNHTVNANTSIPLWDQSWPDGSCIAVPFGSTFRSILAYNVHPDNRSISRIQTQAPLHFSCPNCQTPIKIVTEQPGNIWGATWIWSPTSSDPTSQLFSFKAFDSSGASTQFSTVTLLAGNNPPTVQQVSPSGNDLVYNDLTVIILKFDTNINRPPSHRFVHILDLNITSVCDIDVSLNNSASFINSTMLINVSQCTFEKSHLYQIGWDMAVAIGDHQIGHCGPSVPGASAWNQSNPWSIHVQNTSRPTTTTSTTTISTTAPPYKTSCADWSLAGAHFNGFYNITIVTPMGPVVKQVLCDMETGRGGWTVIQRRSSNSVNFQRGWNDYKVGFGDESNIWLGNEWIHYLTANGDQMLRIDLRDCLYLPYSTVYGRFQIGNESTNYRLTASSYNSSSTAGDSFNIANAYLQNGMEFGTIDNGHDNYGGQCPKIYKGGWWYNRCGASNLNGKYYYGCYYSGVRWPDGIFWYTLRQFGQLYSFMESEMKIRPAHF